MCAPAKTQEHIITRACHPVIGSTEA